MTQAYTTSPGSLSTGEVLHLPMMAIPVARKFGSGGGTLTATQWTTNGNYGGPDATKVSGDYAFDGRAGIQTRATLQTSADVYFNVKLDRERKFDCISVLNHNWDDNDFWIDIDFQIKGDSGSWVSVYKRMTGAPPRDWANKNIHLWNLRGDGKDDDEAFGAGIALNVREFRIHFNKKTSPSAASHAPAMGEIFLGERTYCPVPPSFPWDGGLNENSTSDFARMNWQDGSVDRFEMQNGDVKNYVRFAGRARRELTFSWFEGIREGSPSTWWQDFWTGTNMGTYSFMFQDSTFHMKYFDRLPMLMLLDEPQWVSPLESLGKRSVELAFSELPPFRQNNNWVPAGGGAQNFPGTWYNGSGNPYGSL